MKKILIVFCFIFLIGGAFAYSGVSPSGYKRDFNSKFRESFAFNFILPEDLGADIFIEGDFADYIKVDKSFIKGSTVVVALLELPDEGFRPGIHNTYIRAKQKIEAEDGVFITLNVGGLISVRVPYPGKYAELELETENVNQGEPVNLELIVYSRGDEDIQATAFIDIVDSNGVFIERLNLGTKIVESTKNEKFLTVLDSSDYLSGDYNVNAVVEYGGEVSANISKAFRLGKLFVNISDYTKEFEKNKINRFVIDIESFWNDQIEDVYADVDIIGIEESFKTPSTNLDPWMKTTLNGFMDTSQIDKNEFQANITLYYHGFTTSKIVDLKFIDDANYIIYIIIVFLVFIVFFILYLKRKYKWVKNESKK
jgi:hypothetical protein